MVSDPDRLHELTEGCSATSSRRALRRLLTAIGTGTSVVLGLLSISGPAAAQCAMDFPTEASLKAAHMAIAGGATDVALSPSGCLRYGRDFWPGRPPGAPEHRAEAITFDGKVVEVWKYSASSWSPPDPPPVRLISSGRRDSDMDGFIEWRATIIEDITPPPGPVSRAPVPTEILVTELKEISDPPFQMATRQVKYLHHVGRDTLHITVEVDDGEGSLRVLAEYDAPVFVTNDMRVPAAKLKLPLASVPCPPGLVDQVNTLKFRAAANVCLNRLGLHRDALAMAMVVALRGLDVRCESGPGPLDGAIAAVEWPSIFRRAHPINFYVDVNTWANTDALQREATVFHELMHAALPLQHDKILEDLKKRDFWRYHEMDRIESCTRLCYGQNATKCECATCLGATDCTVQCGTYKPCYSNQIGAVCACPDLRIPTWHDTLPGCQAACRSGLRCAFKDYCFPELNACKM